MSCCSFHFRSPPKKKERKREGKGAGLIAGVAKGKRQRGTEEGREGTRNAWQQATLCTCTTFDFCRLTSSVDDGALRNPRKLIASSRQLNSQPKTKPKEAATENIPSPPPGPFQLVFLLPPLSSCLLLPPHVASYPSTSSILSHLDRTLDRYKKKEEPLWLMDGWITGRSSFSYRIDRLINTY